MPNSSYATTFADRILHVFIYTSRSSFGLQNLYSPVQIRVAPLYRLYGVLACTIWYFARCRIARVQGRKWDISGVIADVSILVFPTFIS